MRMARRAIGALPLVLLVLLAAGAARAEDPHPTYRDFQLSGQYVLYAEGKLVPKAKIYYSEPAAGYLVITEEFECGVLILPRSRCVESVGSDEMIEREDGGLDVRKDATPCSLGHFRLVGPDVTFRVGKVPARLKPKPPLIGGALAPKLLEHTPEYGRAAKTYKPDPKLMEELKASTKKARIQIFFGTWCSFCNRFLPNALKVEQLLGDSDFSFEYFGLPAPPAAWVSETATKMGIKKLPTGIIYIDDKEVGRVVGTEWIRPERSLLKYLR